MADRVQQKTGMESPQSRDRDEEDVERDRVEIVRAER